MVLCFDNFQEPQNEFGLIEETINLQNQIKEYVNVECTNRIKDICAYETKEQDTIKKRNTEMETSTLYVFSVNDKDNRRNNSLKKEEQGVQKEHITEPIFDELSISTQDTLQTKNVITNHPEIKNQKDFEIANYMEFDLKEISSTDMNKNENMKTNGKQRKSKRTCTRKNKKEEKMEKSKRNSENKKKRTYRYTTKSLKKSISQFEKSRNIKKTDISRDDITIIEETGTCDHKLVEEKTGRASASQFKKQSILKPSSKRKTTIKKKCKKKIVQKVISLNNGKIEEHNAPIWEPKKGKKAKQHVNVNNENLVVEPEITVKKRNEIDLLRDTSIVDSIEKKINNENEDEYIEQVEKYSEQTIKGIKIKDNTCVCKFKDKYNKIHRFIFPLYKIGPPKMAKQRAFTLIIHTRFCNCCQNGILCNYVQEYIQNYIF